MREVIQDSASWTPLTKDNVYCSQGITPFAKVDLKQASLASDLAYDVILDIVAPASPRNIELGMHMPSDKLEPDSSVADTPCELTGNFMVDLTLQAADGSTILQSSRAVR